MVSIKPADQQIVWAVGIESEDNINQPVRHQTGQDTENKLMLHLKCRFRPLRDAYLQNDEITEKDGDVVFMCSDGRVKAHKIILASASQFYERLFEGQRFGKMTQVLAPDIPVECVRLLLSLAYKDTVTLSLQQMRNVVKYLKLFGFPAELFTFDGNPIRRAASSGTKTVPVNIPSDTGVGVGISAEKVRVVNQQGQIQPSLSIGSSTRTTAVPSKACTITASSMYLTMKAAQSYKRLAKRQRVDGAEEFGDKFQLHGYGQEQAMLPPKIEQPVQQPKPIVNPQIRTNLTEEPLRRRKQVVRQSHVEPKRVYPVSSLRQIIPKVTPGLHTVVGTFKSPSGHDLQVENEDEEPIGSKHNQLLIQEWVRMRNVGHDDNSQSFIIRHSAGGSESNDGPVKNQCIFCNSIFHDEEQWRWHEARHVGIGLFKCTYCDDLFSTSRKVYEHEMMKHGGTSGVGATDSSAIPSVFKIVQRCKRRVIDYEHKVVQSNQMMEPGGDPPKMKLVRTNHGSHYPLIRAKTDVKDLVESRKVKQLHWLCSKCENASKTLAQAQAHYKKCYRDKEGSTFESSVVKYLEGSFGNFKCPLCARKYTNIVDFAIHCVHMHNEYRRKFALLPEVGTICCMICKKKYENPSGFQEHLSDNGDCNEKPKLGPDDMMSTKCIENGKPEPEEESSAPPRRRRINSRTLSRSVTRLDDPTLTTAQTSINRVDCPICGASQIAKIVDHLQNDHADLNIQVLSVDDTTLRCQKCSISFALFDLLGHQSSCTGSKEVQFGGGGCSTVSGLSGTVVAKVSMEIPPGVGCSPIDIIECSDLSSLDTLKSALKCNVCKKTAIKLGTVAECYRTHGIIRCAICFNTYVDKSSYSAHLKATHAGLVANKLGCPLCDEEFTNVGQTAGHLYKNHWRTLIDIGQSATKGFGFGKFLPNLIDLDKGRDASAAGSSAMIGREVEEVSLQDNLRARAEGINDSDDYSNITLGSLLESAVTNGRKNPVSSSKVATRVIINNKNPGLEDLLNKGDAKKSMVNRSASADEDPNGVKVMKKEDQETERDELELVPETPDGKLSGEFSEANDQVEDDEVEVIEVEEEETGIGINEDDDDDDIEIISYANADEEGEDNDEFEDEEVEVIEVEDEEVEVIEVENEEVEVVEVEDEEVEVIEVEDETGMEINEDDDIEIFPCADEDEDNDEVEDEEDEVIEVEVETEMEISEEDDEDI